MRFALRTAAMAVVLAGVVGGCGSDSSSGSATANTVDITAANITFAPTDIKTAAGEVTFAVKNNDKIEHNLTVESATVNKDVEGGKTIRVKATLKAGTYAFHCKYHPDAMKGTIVVS